MIKPPANSIEALKARLIVDTQIDVACVMAECLKLAADDVATDTSDEVFDDATSRGGLLYRRAHNRMLDVFSDDDRVVCDTTDNALHIRVGSLAISFYSARNGLENPNVSGSKTKRLVVTESQTLLPLGDRQDLRRLVLLHEASEDGLIRVALGLLESASKWSWKVTLFDRFAAMDDSHAEDRGSSYDERPEAAIPPLTPRTESELDQTENG